MATGKRFWTLAIVLGLCVLVSAGCRRKNKRSTTVNTSGVFTTDDFPGASVQDNNVADDRRAFSSSTDDYDGGLVCTHNGDRGTIMVTYDVDDQIFAHYYDGSAWTPGVALRHWDTAIGTTDAGEIVHAFVNTGNDDRQDAADRDGDCLVFWSATDFDSDGVGIDEPNQALYASYFDVSHYTDGDLNHGFDIDPSDPGFYWAQRISSLEFTGEDVEFFGLVTDGLCGEARWTNGAHSYSYGDDTTAIFVFWHENEEKAAGIFDEITASAGFDLDFVVDEEFALLATGDTEVAIQTFGASDTGVTCRESCVDVQYSSYNGILMYRVQSLVAASYGSVTPYPANPGFDSDVTLQYTHFDMDTFTRTTDCLNTYDPNSGVTSVDEMNSTLCFSGTLGFLGANGLTTYGRDEGLSCLVTFFAELSDPNNTAGLGWFTEDAEDEIVIAEIDEDTGAYLNDAEPSILDIDDPTVYDYIVPEAGYLAQISRNGDYIWVVYGKINGLGTADNFNPEVVQYLTTRLDGDGNPVAIPPLSTTLGLPTQFDPEDGPVGLSWMCFQDNLGYRCGIQSDAQVMHLFWSIQDATTLDSLIYYTTLTADVDGTIGGETASPATLLVDEEVNSYHGIIPGFINASRSTFNATDAGQDGDFVYAFTYDDSEVPSGLSDTYIAMGRVGVTAASPIEVGSGISERHVQYNGDPLWLIATPPGTEIGAWNVDSAEYDGGAHHGAEFVHLVFREAETASVPLTGPNTDTGWALRTRTYHTDLSGGTFGDDFTPNAGTAFRKPFDIDLPFIDPGTAVDAEVMDVLVCDNTVVLIFTEAGHVYYQECNPGDGGDDETGWRQEAPGVSDPALVDDDTPELLLSFEEVCTRSCTCCTIEGAAIFWVKNLDDGSSNDRLQVRVINGN